MMTANRITFNHFTAAEIQLILNKANKKKSRCEVVINNANIDDELNLILYEKIGGALSQIPREYIKLAIINNDFDELFNTPTLLIVQKAPL